MSEETPNSNKKKLNGRPTFENILVMATQAFLDEVSKKHMRPYYLIQKRNKAQSVYEFAMERGVIQDLEIRMIIDHLVNSQPEKIFNVQPDYSIDFTPKWKNRMNILLNYCHDLKSAKDKIKKSEKEKKANERSRLQPEYESEDDFGMPQVISESE